MEGKEQNGRLLMLSLIRLLCLIIIGSVSILRVEAEDSNDEMRRAVALLDKGDYPAAKKVLRQIQQESRASGDELMLLNVETTLGQTMVVTGEEDEGAELLRRALRGCAEMDSKGIEMGPLYSQIYNGLGIYNYTVRGEYYLGKEYFLKAIEAAKKCGNEKLRRRFETNVVQIAIMERDTTFYTQALDNYESVKEGNDPVTTFIAATNLAQMELFVGHNGRASQLLEEARKIAVEEGIKDLVSFYLVEAGLYESRGEMKSAAEAIDRAEKSIEDGTEAPHNRLLVESRRLRLFIKSGKYADAIKTGKRALKMSRDLHQRGQYDLLLLHISQAYESMGQRDTALVYARQYEHLRDATVSSDREYMIRELSTIYHVESKEAEAKSARNQLQTERQRNLLLAIGLILMVIVVVIAVRGYIVKSRLHRKVVSLYKELLDKDKTDFLPTNSSPIRTKDSDDSDEKTQQADNPVFDKIWSDFVAFVESTTDWSEAAMDRDSVADRLGTNRTYLSKVVKERTDKSYSQFINSVRIKRAIEILSDPAQNDLPIKAIGADLGFGSLNAFYANFKAVTGLSPASFRRSASRK